MRIARAAFEAWNRGDFDALLSLWSEEAEFYRFRARGRTSGLDLNVPLGVIGTVRNERIVYARMFSDPAEALKAAGLRE